MKLFERLLSKKEKGATSATKPSAPNAFAPPVKKVDGHLAPVSKAVEKPWWEVLGLDRDRCTLDDVRVAFRRKISRYHTDRLQDLDDASKVIAMRQSVEINNAYKQAKLAKMGAPGQQ